MRAGRPEISHLPKETVVNVPKPLIGVLVLALAGLAACGGQAEPGGEPDDGAGPRIEVRDSRGTVTLDGPATRVVALEWAYVEDLLSLGVSPVGIADKAGYDQWVSAAGEAPGDATDVGTRQEPSIETVQSLSPDLIITDTARSAGSLEQLEAIAPTLVFDPTPDDVTIWQEMRQTFTEIAKATGKTAKGRRVLADLDTALDDAERRLSAAGLAGAPVAVAQGFTAESVPTLRMFTGRSLAGAIIERVGLTNAWTGRPDEWGFTTVDVEALTKVSSADFLYVADPADNIFTGALKDNAVWKGLDFVRTDRVHALDAGTWFFGGPASSKQAAEEIVKALA